MEHEAAAQPDTVAESLRRTVEDYERWFRTMDAQMRVLERERQKLSAVLNHTDAGFLVFDASLRTIWANDVFTQRFCGGAHAGAILGEPCHRVLCGRESLCSACPASRPLTSGAVAHHEIRLEIEGQPRHIYATAMPIATPEGRIDETIVMLQDVTDLAVLRRSREALRASEERFRSIFENAGAGMATVSPDGSFLQVNPALCAFLGYTEPELLEMNVTDVTHPDDLEASLRIITEALAGRSRVADLEKRYVRKDGAIVWGHLSVTWLVGADRKPTYAVSLIQDITERKRLEEQLRQSQRLESVGTLAGGVAHDFNNILTGILGYAEMLKLGAHPPNVLQAAQVIGKAARRGAELTQQLLGFARKGKQQDVPVDLHATIRDVVALLDRTIDKKIRIATRLEAEGALLLGDPGQIQQVILNLALNARDAMPEGGDLKFTTATAQVDGGRHLLVSVADTGAGISAEIRGRIFEPFFTTKERGKGTGMGLAMVYGIIKSHGGFIRLDTEPGRGTTFHVYLPADPGLAAPHPAGLSNGEVRGAGCVLIVDDEEDVREVLAGFLQHLGYDVVTASDGDEAVAAYAKSGGGIDLVIIDMVMPRMDGRECFRSLRRMDPGVKAVLSTGFGFGVAAQEMLDEGMLAFVQKPYGILRLSEVVAKALAK